jgi:ribonuclease Y
MSYSGVEKAFALQAGREIRIFVDADEISDIDSLALARNIASEIEEKLSYPGEVKVNLIREKRVIEYAR